MKKALGILILSLSCGVGLADQFQLANAREAHQVFWETLYADGGWTLYCGDRFEKQRDLVIEEVYPIERVQKLFGCATREACRKENARFNRIEADLHNLYPATMMIDKARKDYDFGIIPGEYREFFECDFEHDVRDQRAEPRAAARGNVARAILYMYLEYDLPIETQTAQQLLIWNNEDPPSQDEIRRNDVIQKLQGTRNIFIDNPARADGLVFK
jgi:deoxyribonuclease-1